MCRKNFYIVAFFVLISPFLLSQSGTTQDIDILKLRIQNYITQSGFETERGQFYSAKDNLNKALGFAKDLGDKKIQGIIYTKIAKIQFIVEEPENALVSLTKAAELQRESNDYANLALTYNVRGLLHASKKEYPAALEYFNSAKSRFEEEGLERLITEVNLNEAKVFIQLKDYKTAKSKLEKAIILAKKYDQIGTLSSAYINSGKVHQKLGNSTLALTMTKQGLELAKNNNIPEYINDSYLTLSEIYQDNDEYILANDYLRKYIKLSDSLLDIKRKNLSLENIAQNVNDYKDSEFKQMEVMIEEADASNNLTRITTILSIALITILSLLTLSLYKNNNIRLKTNNMLHKKNDELIIAKEKAELASTTKANFLSTVTHELRTPLYAITGLTNLLLDEEPKPDQLPHLKSLKFSGDYLLTFINDILQINKIEANKVELDPEVFNLKKKVENVISALSNSASDNSTQLHYEYDESLPLTFMADQLKISQILINLIGNAIKFTKDGDIWVKLSNLNHSDGNYTIRFEIKDNGIGITKEKQEHIFESFSQGSIQINRKYGGTGLGLSIVNGLIEILKGKIYLKSELGKGSSFFFEIPLTYAPEPILTAKPKTLNKINTLDLTNFKILVVEDNKINQMITRKILSKMNLYCDVVDNGEEAVERVQQERYDVVLMDIHMPGISGLEATKIIRTFDKELTIFALTAVTIEDKMHEFDEAGFNDIISKPFKQKDFEKKVYSVLKKSQKQTPSI